MKGAKCSLILRLRSLCLVRLFGRSYGLLRSMSRRTSTARPTSALSSGASSAASGMRSVSLVTPFVVASICFSLLFPTVASANPATITLTVWNAFVTAVNLIDAGISTSAAVTSAEDLQVIASNLRIWTGTPSQAQTIAQELERVSGYDIDSGNHINTVHSLTGNGSYDQEQICPDCAGGYVATDWGELVVCDTCGGDGFYYWDTVPYTSTHECMVYLASWIEYLSATQTDWSGIADTGGVTNPDYALLTLTDTLNWCPITSTAINHAKSHHTFYASGATFANGAVSASGSRLTFSYFSATNYTYCANVRLYMSGAFQALVNRYTSNGKYVLLGLKLPANNSTAVNVVVSYADSFSYSSTHDSYSNFSGFSGVGMKVATVCSGTMYHDSNGLFCVPSGELSNDFTSSEFVSPAYTYVLSPSSSASGGNGDSGITWGVDTEWYTDTSEGGAAGPTTVVNEGDTIYNTENNTYETTYNMDVEPITQRLDVLNAINAQIGVDLRTLDASMFKELNDLEWWLQKVYYLLSTANNNLENIRSDMANLDRSTNDLVDLSTLESGVSGLSSDIGALLNAVTGSHGADALGLYGRLDTVLNWLDDYTPVDVSGIEQALEDWPDYPTFDDSGLLNAITGSHGSDLLGLFGRLDNVLSWLDDYVSPDLSTLNHQLGDLLDSDGQTPTVHGLIYSVNGYVEDIDGLLSDVLALGTVTVNGTTYGFTDLLYNTWLDLSRLVGMSTVTAGEDTYSFADLLYNVWVDFGRLRDWLVEWWADLFARLDDIIDAIEDLPHNGSNPWHTSPVVDPSDPQGGPIIGPIETDPYGYPKMPDWQTYKEPLNIPALQHAVDELMTKFPFSMLNTIVQVAMFIERPAVAPQFDIPAPNPSDWSQPYLVHVDLSDYDTVAATLRLGIVIWAIVRISNRTINMWVGDKGGS